MVKTYRRFTPSGALGVVASRGGCVFVPTKPRPLVAAAALGGISLWDLRTGEQRGVLGELYDKTSVTKIAASPNGKLLAAGYSDGAVRLFDLVSSSELVCFSGHRAEVSALRFILDGSQLVSGSNDCHVIVWDVVAEAGLVRLKGHKGPVTDVAYLPTRRLLLTCSKDTFVKIWDLDTQHCVQTLVGHRNEVYSLVASADERFLITGSADHLLRLWLLSDAEPGATQPLPAAPLPADESSTAGSTISAAGVVCTLAGTVPRTSHERVASLQFNSDCSLLGCQAADRTLEIFRLRTDAEVASKLARRQKRRREKRRSQAANGSAAAEDEEDDEDGVAEKPDDRLAQLTVLRASSKISSFDFAPDSTRESTKHEVVLGLNNNAIEGFLLKGAKKLEASKSSSITIPGHRSPIRAVTMSSDDALIATGSQKEVKIWNRLLRSCIRTFESGQCTAAIFVPGNRHVVFGTKAGELQLFDIAAGTMLENIQAHSDAIVSLALLPDKLGFVSGSSDKEVKFWEFELISDAEYSKSSKRLSCTHARTLKLGDAVTCLCVSADQRFLAVALLDTTVKVFFVDTLKFFLSLYGHKLPVLSMDISSDSTLLATGSQDKNIKLWGLDFGDCHKSFFAHQDAVTTVKFVGSTHYLFSGSRDKCIKQWDCDVFELITTMEGHQGEIWAMAVSSKGQFLVSTSHDRSIRVWERSEDLLTLDEEREAEREAAYDAEQAADEAKVARARDGHDEAGLAGKRTTETLKAAERLMEAMELADREAQKLPGVAPDPMLLAYGGISGDEYVLQELCKVSSSELDEALLVLPFSYVEKLLAHLNSWIMAGKSTERCCRALFFLVRVHHNQIVATSSLLPVLDSLRQHTRLHVDALRDTCGFNLAGLRFLQRQLQVNGVRLFEDVAGKVEQSRKKRRVVQKKK